MTPGWESKLLSEVCEVFADGDWIESKDQSLKGIRLVQTGNIGLGVFKDREHKARYISEETFARLKCTEIFPKDCLISRLPDPVGRACIIPDIQTKMITGVDCSILRFKKNIYPQWFVYYSLSQDYQRQIDEQISGATRQRISRGNLGNILIPIPSFPEQKRIVAGLDEAFDAIAKAKENAEKNLANARELFDSYLHSAFASPSNEWEVKTLPQISENLDSKRVPITRSKRKSGRYPYYGASGIVDHVAEYIFDEDLLLISEDGANLLARVTPVAFSVSGKLWVNNHAHILKFKNFETQKYVERYFASIKLDEYITGAAQPKLNQSALNSIVIPVPPLSEQRSIVAKLDTLSAETKKLEAIYQKKLSDFEELKKSILKKAFSGELAGARS